MSPSKEKALKEGEDADGLSIGKKLQNIQTVGTELYSEVHCEEHHG